MGEYYKRVIVRQFAQGSFRGQVVDYDSATGFRILDRHGGFSLLEGCLQQRPHSRISSAAAARSRFCFV